MRKDCFGFFWDDMPVERQKKVKEKRTPPERTWERPDYLPGLLEAIAFPVQLFTLETLWQAVQAREEFVWDIECYPNYFLVAFKSIQSKRVIYFESFDDQPIDVKLLEWVLTNVCIVGFNSISYDEPMINIALTGANNIELYQATVDLIVNGQPAWSILRSKKIKKIKVDHIDLIEVCPLMASLKIYAGRLHCRKMQDLPFKPGTLLTRQQSLIVRLYCVNDLDNTALIRYELREEITLREHLSDEYGIDLRSKSDAQIAEAVIGRELENMGSSHLRAPPIEIGRVYNYEAPKYLRFETQGMQSVLQFIKNSQFVVGESGAIGLPESFKDLNIRIGTTDYQMGIGGLHSKEKSRSHVSGATFRLFDFDVTSFYPRIILNLGLYPEHIGPQFLRVYGGIVDRRVAAKKAKRNIEANSLKIVANGSYGKLGSKFSILYAPHLVIQTTLTGQLSLFMLIEALENRGIPVVSANTDGIVIKCPTGQEEFMRAIIQWWEKETNFQLEDTEYKALYSKDVNNYIAIKMDGGVKGKGEYANPWSDPKMAIFRFHKNPVTTVCIDAVYALLTKGTDPYKYIRECKDVTKFVAVRKVKDGAVKDGEFLGSSIRFYYALNSGGEMVYAKNGNLVPRSTGAKPLLEMNGNMPEDLDYAAYDAVVDTVLKNIAYSC